MKRAGSTDADKMVEALEKTDWEGTIGRIQFYGKDDPFTHSIKYGKGLITGLMLQWQDGKQVSVWPKEVAKGQLKFPSFIKVTVELNRRTIMLPGCTREHFRICSFLESEAAVLPRPSSMLAFQILIDGFAISALYALGATGFTLIFGVSGVLNLSHGAIMVLAAVAAWAAASVLHTEHLCRRADRRRGRARCGVRDLFRGGAADPEIDGASPTRRRKSSSSPAPCCGGS